MHGFISVTFIEIVIVVTSKEREIAVCMVMVNGGCSVLGSEID